MTSQQIRQRLDELLQQGPLAGLSADLKLLLQGQLSAWLTKANLVTREEFDAQTEVLRRTEQKLFELEQKITELEQQAH